MKCAWSGGDERTLLAGWGKHGSRKGGMVGVAVGKCCGVNKVKWMGPKVSLF